MYRVTCYKDAKVFQGKKGESFPPVVFELADIHMGKKNWTLTLTSLYVQKSFMNDLLT